MSGTDPKGGMGRRDERTRAFGRGGAPEPEHVLPPDVPKIPGITLHYEIARGGMGVVYSGRQDFLDRRVAVKFLSVELGGASFAQRFQREAKILAGIKHPNIVACHMAGTTDDGQSYLVMEFIDGPSLKAWIHENGPLSVCAALRLARAVGSALGHAHQMEVIHRDVKPENILLETVTSTAIDVQFPFTPKLVDLGLARMTHEQAGMGLTSPGSVMGTPSTMSPEQFDEPDAVDFRSDIYGLGCALYEMLVGKPAYAGRKLTDIVTMKRQRVGPDPCVGNPQVPRAVGALVQRMLAADRNDRPASYKELDELLGELIQVVAASAKACAPQGRTEPDGDAPTMVSGDRAPTTTAPALDANRTGPGLLRTAELDFLAAGGAIGGEEVAPAFREGTSVGGATGPATSARTAPDTASPQAQKNRGALLAVVALAVVAAAGGVYFGTRSGGGGGGGEDGPPPATLAVKVAGKSSVTLGEEFTLTAEVPGGQGTIDYQWEWPDGVVPVRPARGAKATFRLDDGLPGVPFDIGVAPKAGDSNGWATHRVTCADFPPGPALLDLKVPGSPWRRSTEDRRVWPETLVLKDEERYVAVNAEPGQFDSVTATLDLGNEHYWEWSGSLRSEELFDAQTEQDSFAQLGLRFTVGEQVVEVRSGRSDEGGGRAWVRCGDQNAEATVDPEDTDREARGAFRVQRRGPQLRVQVGMLQLDLRNDDPRKRAEPSWLERKVDVADSATVTLTLFVEKGRGKFFVQTR